VILSFNTCSLVLVLVLVLVLLGAADVQFSKKGIPPNGAIRLATGSCAV
jgi:hypothetical protein